jgi:deazaflavin-dependent oxidoreductase (nitroreductase family)
MSVVDGPGAADPAFAAYAAEDHCDLTTTGRRTGRAHTVEIWFAIHDGSVFIIGDPSRPDWYRNVVADGRVGVRLGDLDLVGRAARVTDTARRRLAGRLLATKYRSSLSTADVAEPEPEDELDGQPGGEAGAEAQPEPTSWAYGGVAIEITNLMTRT